MSGTPVNPTYYADFQGLESLKATSKSNDAKSVKAVAQQFESLFTNMMLKSMREANLGEGMGDSQATDMYTDMFDQQISLQMAQGKGLGLADMLVQQLTRSGLTKAHAAESTAAGSSATGAAGTTATPATTGAATSGGSATQAEKISFVQSLTPYAMQAAQSLGVSSDAVIAQAALETGWGKHLPSDAQGNSSQNLFGIKAGGSWSGSALTSNTTEVQSGEATTLPQAFRSYDSTADSMTDYVALLSNNSRYAAALGTGDNTAAFATALQRGGYATDPNYAQKLVAATQSVKAVRAAAHSEAALKLVAGLPTSSGGEPT